MKDEGAPQRLLALADPDSVLGRGLVAARNRGPSQEDIRALERRLAATLGVAAVGTAVAVATTKSAATTAASAWLSAGAIKVTTAVVVAALGVSGGAVAWKRHAAARSRTVGDVAVSGTPPRARRIGAPVVEPAVPVTPEVAARDEAAPAAAASLVPRPPARLGARTATRSAMLAEQPTRARGIGDDPALADELNLIDRAQHALRDDPRQALALVQEHARRFPNQLLEQEREVIAVAALVKLDRKSEAAERAQRFVSRFPQSAHAVRMRAMAASQ